jgi:hypothetical protein
MNITDIIPDFSKLSDAEVEEVIRRGRTSRTTAKPVSLAKRPTKTAETAVKKNKKDISKIVDGMNAEQLAMLAKLFS